MGRLNPMLLDSHLPFWLLSLAVGYLKLIIRGEEDKKRKEKEEEEEKKKKRGEGRVDIHS